MMFHSFSKFKVLPIISHWKLLVTHHSTVTAEEMKHIHLLFSSKTYQSLYSTILDKSKLEKYNSICSIILGIKHVSWTKVTIPNLNITDWNAIQIKLNLTRSKFKEESFLPAASKIISEIPKADLYVMEYQKWNSFITEIYLRAVLISLLCSQNGVIEEDKIIFQRRKVLDLLHDLLIARERKPAKNVVKDILKKIHGKNIENNCFIPEWYSKVVITQNMELFFHSSQYLKQESLSLAFLVALTFLNMNYAMDYKSLINKSLK